MVKGITYILTHDTDFQTKVGRNNADTKYKAYPGYCPNPEKFPYSVVRLTGKSVFAECKGMEPSAFTYNYEVLSFEESYDKCEAIDLAVVDVLSKPDGGSFNGVVFKEIRWTGTRDDVTQLTQNSSAVLHVKISSFEAIV